MKLLKRSNFFSDGLKDDVLLLLKYFGDNRKALADELGIHVCTLSRWLNGRTQPSPHEAELVISLLQRMQGRVACRLAQMYSAASPHLRDAFKRLLECGASALEELDPGVRDELCDFLFKLHPEYS